MAEKTGWWRDASDERWIVTGGASGIGRALTHGLRNRGAEVHVWDINEPEDGREWWHRVDLLDVSAVADLAASFEGSLTCLAHVAGAVGYADVTDVSSTATFDAQMALHCRSLLAAVPGLVPRLSDGGSIVAVTALATQMVYRGGMPYGASKAALERIVSSLAVELGPLGIRANALAPGTTITPITAKGLADERKMEIRRRAIPLARAAEAEEIAVAIEFLGSPLASFITGVSLLVDGGLHLGLGTMLGGTPSQELKA